MIAGDAPPPQTPSAEARRCRSRAAAAPVRAIRADADVASIRTAGSSTCSVCAGGLFSSNAGPLPQQSNRGFLRNATPACVCNGETRTSPPALSPRVRAAEAPRNGPGPGDRVYNCVNVRASALTPVGAQGPPSAPPAHLGPTPAPRVGSCPASLSLPAPANRGRRPASQRAEGRRGDAKPRGVACATSGVVELR